MLLGFLARGDVADCRRHQGALRTFQWTEHNLDRKLTSILPSARKFNPGFDQLCESLRRGRGTIGDQPFREALRNDVLYWLTHQFIATVSELFLGLNVQQNDFP